MRIRPRWWKGVGLLTWGLFMVSRGIFYLPQLLPPTIPAGLRVLQEGLGGGNSLLYANAGGWLFAGACGLIGAFRHEDAWAYRIVTAWLIFSAALYVAAFVLYGGTAWVTAVTFLVAAVIVVDRWRARYIWGTEPHAQGGQQR